MAQLLQDLMEEAGLPKGVYQNVYAKHEQISTIIADPRVREVYLGESFSMG